MNFKQTIATIVSPLAVATSFLFFILSLLEFYRRGFVSLFIDLRLLMIVALVLLIVAAITQDEAKHRSMQLVMIIIVLLSCLPVLWMMVAPFGRLGLATFAIGIITAILVIVACAKTLNLKPNN